MNSQKTKHKKRKFTKRNMKAQMPLSLKDYYHTKKYEDISVTFPSKTIEETINYFFYNYEFSKRTAWFQKVTFTYALTKIRNVINYYGKNDFYKYIYIFHELNKNIEKDKYFTELMKYINDLALYIDCEIFEELDSSSLIYESEFIYPDLIISTNNPRLLNLMNNYLKYGYNYLETRDLESMNYINSKPHFLKAYELGFVPVNMLEVSYL